jgi:hypothetical protein
MSVSEKSLVGLVRTQNELLRQLIKRLDEQTAARQAIDGIVRETAMRVEVLVREHETRQAAIVRDLTERQRQVFEAIDALPAGNGPEQRSSIERELAKLRDDPVSEPLVNALKIALRHRELGIAGSKKFSSAAPSWQPDPSLALGGRMRYVYRSLKGKPLYGENFPKMPTISLVVRQDKRRKGRRS